jgi:hypothetical protein
MMVAAPVIVLLLVQRPEPWQALPNSGRGAYGD